MSLVAYGASDDSDASETEDDVDVTLSHAPNSEAEAEAVTSTSAVKTNAIADSESTSKDQEEDSNISSSSKTQAAASSKVESELVEEDELEEEVKPKKAEIASAPVPPSKQSKQRVRITIPSLDEIPVPEESKKKCVSSSSKPSSLFSLLPAPIHSSKKEINRPLIPHSLKKNPSTVSKSTPQPAKATSTKSASEVAPSSDSPQKRMTHFNALTGYDSDSDEDGGDKDQEQNFFSLSANSSVSSRVKGKGEDSVQSEEISSSERTIIRNTNVDDKVIDKQDEKEEEAEVDPGPEPGAVNDAPLDFMSTNRLNSWSSNYSSTLGAVGPSGVVQPSTYGMPSNALYNLAHSEATDVEDMNPDGNEVPDIDLKQFLSEKEFLKFQGKRKRGMEEAISFVDAKVDDYVDPSEISKYMTEETEHMSHKKKDDMPTSQQKRKKQITYLAYQAKEKELELKNTWSQNRMTKKQTQSKYGF